MRIKYYLLLITTLLFLSCVGKGKSTIEKHAVASKPNESLKTDIRLSSEEDIKEFISKNESLITKDKMEIMFIDKINLGIPGGDNWIVKLSKQWTELSSNMLVSSNMLALYSINNNGIEKSLYTACFNMEEYSKFDIMQDIPGTRIGDSTSSIGDFNGDGVNEVFEYGFYGGGFIISIWGYDAEKDDFAYYCEISFRLIDEDNGPAPVKFMTYNGMYGFKVFYVDNAVALSYYTPPNPRNNKWYFYTWDSEQRKYVEVGEVAE